MSKQKAEDFSDLVKEKIPEYITLSEVFEIINKLPLKIFINFLD